MLIFSAQSLAFIAVPKTGTTAVEMALRGKADIAFHRQRKHLTAQKFHNKVAPFLAEAFGLHPERFAVIREPEEQLRSWYRYRAREGNIASDRKTTGVSFDEFVLAVISDDPPEFAKVGSQFRMLTARSGDVLVHHLFAYENQPVFRGFLTDRFGEGIEVEPKNISPATPASIEPSTRRKLHMARQQEFDLHARVLDADGHLKSRMPAL